MRQQNIKKMFSFMKDYRDRENEWILTDWIHVHHFKNYFKNILDYLQYNKSFH